MSDVSRSLSVRLRGHSYIAYALTPEWPIGQWLTELDESIDCFAEFFVGKPVVLDLSKVTLSQSGVSHLIAELQTRSMRIMKFGGVCGSPSGLPLWPFWNHPLPVRLPRTSGPTLIKNLPPNHINRLDHFSKPAPSM